MKRVLFSLIFICLVSSGIAFSQSDAKLKAKPDAKTVCPFSIIGLWRSDVTSQANPILFNFSPEGGVALLGHSEDTLPQDLEIITTINYKLDKPTAPKRIEFTAWRGNDVFPPGVTLMEISEYSDDSFTTRNPASGQQTRWVREQTHRYFLTLAARSGISQPGGPAFAMWTVLDGSQPKIEALGVRLTKDNEDKDTPVFEPIPAELYEQITEESDEDKKNKKYETVIMRLELPRAEFEKTHKVFEEWSKYVKTRALPNVDPYMNGMDFIKRVVESLNPCGEKLKLQKLDRAATDEIAAKHNLRQRPLEYIRAMRKKNGEAHITDAMFAIGWRPILQLP